MTNISRQDWGARPAKGHRVRLDRRQVQGIALHWPVIDDPITSVDQACRALRGYQAHHMEGNGWSDIAYQIAVDQAGNSYRLRGLKNRSAANGDSDVNSRYGALLLLLAINEDPTPAMVATVRRKIARHRELFPLSGRIVGHRDIRPSGPTSCPGPAVTRLLDAGVFEPKHPRKGPR